jgi:hypothetical protein
MRRYDGRDASEILPPSLPEPVQFEPNKQYLRELLATQIGLFAMKRGDGSASMGL